MRLRPHPLLDVLPALTPEEIERNVDRVRLFGQREAIEVIGKQVVAGWSEYVACIEVGIRPKVNAIAEPPRFVEYVVRRNVPRHLSSLDRACIAVLAQHHYKTLGRERMRDAGRLGGRSKGRAQVARPFAGERWFETAARLVGTTPGAVRILANIHKNHPDVFEAVRSRRVKMMRDARALTRLPAADARAEALRRFASAPHAEQPPMLRVVTEIEREARLRASPNHPSKGSSYAVHHGAMEDVGQQISSASVDAIYADIIYGDVQMAANVAALAARVLVRGGVLALISGNEHCAAVLAAVRQHLTLITIGSLVLPGSTCSIRGVKRVDSIPIFFFSRGPRLARPIMQLAFISRPASKAGHAWEKGLAATRELVEAIADPGALVLDPCCGSGTSGVAAIQAGRRFIGIDVDTLAVKASRARLAEAERGLGDAVKAVRTG